jgi:hypothetical protein
MQTGGWVGGTSCIFHLSALQWGAYRLHSTCQHFMALQAAAEGHVKQQPGARRGQWGFCMISAPAILLLGCMYGFVQVAVGCLAQSGVAFGEGYRQQQQQQPAVADVPTTLPIGCIIIIMLPNQAIASTLPIGCSARWSTLKANEAAGCSDSGSRQCGGVIEWCGSCSANSGQVASLVELKVLAGVTAAFRVRWRSEQLLHSIAACEA